MLDVPQRLGSCAFVFLPKSIVQAFEREPPSILAVSAYGAVTSNFPEIDAVTVCQSPNRL
jgi:hypothetical protein